MTYGDRVVLLHRNPAPMACLESFSYRQACLTFLHAALNGAPGERLKQLADEMWRAKEGFLGQQVPPMRGLATGDRSRS